MTEDEYEATLQQAAGLVMPLVAEYIRRQTLVRENRDTVRVVHREDMKEREFWDRTFLHLLHNMKATDARDIADEAVKLRRASFETRGHFEDVVAALHSVKAPH